MMATFACQTLQSYWLAYQCWSNWNALRESWMWHSRVDNWTDTYASTNQWNSTSYHLKILSHTVGSLTCQCLSKQKKTQLQTLVSKVLLSKIPQLKVTCIATIVGVKQQLRWQWINFSCQVSRLETWVTHFTVKKKMGTWQFYKKK